MGIPPVQPQPGDAVDVAAERTNGAGFAEDHQPPPGGLPIRPAGNGLVRRIRRTDDPEILERVLEGLINLT